MTGVDFGFNFDTIVNTNDAGQGSLRQFLLNSNALQNTNLAQSGLPAGVETSLFMIPSNADPLGRAKDPGFDAARGVAVIAPTALLPALADAATAIDGTTQTAKIGDTNPGTLGAGGTVGTGADGIAGNGDDATLPTVSRPEIELRDGNNLPTGIEIAAGNAVLRGIAIYGFGSGLFNDGFTNVKVGSNGTNYTGTLIEQNVIGAGATSFADPGAGARSDGDNVRVNGGDSGTIRNNLIGFATGTGVGLLYGSDGWTVTGNEIRRQGLGTPLADGIGLENSSGHTIGSNLIVDARGVGIDMYSSAGSTTITGNTIRGNGIAGNETPGVRVYGANNVVTSNLIHGNYGAGVMVIETASATRISRNSIYDNGTILTESGGAASNQVGIDLLASGDNASRGSAPFFTLNDSGDGDAGGNGLLNFPVLLSAVLTGSNLTVAGFTRPGSTIEFFATDSDPSGFGEGKTYLFTGVEGSPQDTDTGTGTYGPGAVNGLVQGTDTTNRFTFSVTLPAGVGAVTSVTATARDGSSNTSEFCGGVTVGKPTIVKRGFLPDGTPVPDGTVLPKGTRLRFLLYVNNPGLAISDVSVQDVLAPAFAFEAGSIRTTAAPASCALTTCSAAEESAIFAAADGGTVGTDAIGDDTVGYAAPTIHAGDQSVANLRLDVPAGRVWAIVFSVTVH